MRDNNKMVLIRFYHLNIFSVCDDESNIGTTWSEVLKKQGWQSSERNTGVDADAQMKLTPVMENQSLQLNIKPAFCTTPILQNITFIIMP